MSVRTEKGDQDEGGGRENKEEFDFGGGNLTQRDRNALKTSLAFIFTGFCADGVCIS